MWSVQHNGHWTIDASLNYSGVMVFVFTPLCCNQVIDMKLIRLKEIVVNFIGEKRISSQNVRELFEENCTLQRVLGITTYIWVKSSNYSEQLVGVQDNKQNMYIKERYHQQDEKMHIITLLKKTNKILSRTQKGQKNI